MSPPMTHSLCSPGLVTLATTTKIQGDTLLQTLQAVRTSQLSTLLPPSQKHTLLENRSEFFSTRLWRSVVKKVGFPSTSVANSRHKLLRNMVLRTSRVKQKDCAITSYEMVCSGMGVLSFWQPFLHFIEKTEASSAPRAWMLLNSACCWPVWIDGFDSCDLPENWTDGSDSCNVDQKCLFAGGGQCPARFLPCLLGQVLALDCLEH